MTTTMYKLPILPGEMIAHHRKTYAGTDYAGFYVEGEIVWVPVALLVEVKQLPPEPPVGSHVNAGSRVLHRRDDAGIDWRDLEGDRWLTWAQVCELGTPVLLVPAPEPVELPWYGEESDGGKVTVERYDAGNVAMILAGRATAWFPLATARDVARALLAAADQAEATS